MRLRELSEEREEKLLSPRAARSRLATRRFPERECDVRTAFQRDRDRIIHSKAFRRLKHKTQVFIAPEGDHYRTRLTHTLEVCQIARTVARALGLNEDLTEAIALGHDLGHTPFGHGGEDVLDMIHPGGFRHNEQSLRVVDVLEGGEHGLNLTNEVRDGILHHTGPVWPSTPEGRLVRHCDRIAYINHDIDDALRAGILAPGDLPGEAMSCLGYSSSARINKMVRALIENSRDDVTPGEEMANLIDNLREFMFQQVYIGSAAKQETERVQHVMETLYRFLIKNPKYLPEEILKKNSETGVERAACDYVAGMTDRYIIARYQELFLPKPWKHA